MLVENYSNSRSVRSVAVLTIFSSLQHVKLTWVEALRTNSISYFFIDCAIAKCRTLINLPGWRWARINQLALAKSSNSPHSEVCKASEGSSGIVHGKISV